MQFFKLRDISDFPPVGLTYELMTAGSFTVYLSHENRDLKCFFTLTGFFIYI